MSVIIIVREEDNKKRFCLLIIPLKTGFKVFDPAKIVRIKKKAYWKILTLLVRYIGSHIYKQ